jgi:hypothetical protein
MLLHREWLLAQSAAKGWLSVHMRWPGNGPACSGPQAPGATTMNTITSSNVRNHRQASSRNRWIAALITFEAVTLAVASGMHLSGAVDSGSKPLDASDAGLAEAIICAAARGWSHRAAVRPGEGAPAPERLPPGSPDRCPRGWPGMPSARR